MILDPFEARAKELLNQMPSLGEMGDKFEKNLDYIYDRIDGEVEENEELDIITFYGMALATALNGGFGSEMKLFLNINSEIYKDRIIKSFKKLGWEVTLENLKYEAKNISKGEIPEEFQDRNIKFKMRLKEFSNLLGEIDLTNYYIRAGWIYLSPSDFVNIWENKFEKNSTEFIRNASKHNEKIPKILEKVSDKLESESEPYKIDREIEADELDSKYFPPCIKKSLEGVPSGNRNFAVTVLLTAFISYARIVPEEGQRISEHIDSMDFIEEEIMPYIRKAAERCDPPLFEEQPKEIENIYYHLGFGLTDSPNLEDSGRSPWYLPPNCHKIQKQSVLCRPDDFCKKIKNPLSYYFAKKKSEN